MNKTKLIIKTVCKVMQLKEQAVMSKNRQPDLVYARYFMMYFSKKHLGLSLQQIGDNIGGKDHATVLNALKRVDDLQFTKQQPYYEYFKLLEQRFEKSLNNTKIHPYIYTGL